MRFHLQANRSDLAVEFKAQPYGHHSPELEAALDQLRLINPKGKIIPCVYPTGARMDGGTSRWRSASGGAAFRSQVLEHRASRMGSVQATLGMADRSRAGHRLKG